MAEKRLIDANELLRFAKFDARVIFPCKHTASDILCMVETAPTVDAVEVADMKEFAEDVVHQFGYYCQNKGRLHITHGGLSTLEWAFDILGWENPHPVPEYECEIDGCHEHATCGTLTVDGYKRVCSKHCRERESDDFCSGGKRKMVNLEDVVDIEAQTKANNEAMRKVVDFMVGERRTDG